ncbi:hypothetical protein [Streptosporangium lutulentum]|uniref:Uncharacterized protein n=1 Tax=Streptosporangium lutulentum TaxID=1461250 RepID=A0ABT9QFG5_9ACTN|nr:hypothetical protein [Streptosporangium lutulentum]MDP9845498.1 hypothetical protein [Streptosporangium lutulentum]
MSHNRAIAAEAGFRAAMVEAAWVTARTRSSVGTRLRRLGRGFGKQHAQQGAVADTLLPPCFVIA